MKSETLEKLSEEGIGTLTEYEAKKVLRDYDIPCPNEHLVEYDENITDKLSDFQAEKKGLNYPLFLKVCSRDILHKTDAKVIEKANSDNEIREKGEKILENAKNYDKNAEIQGILLSEDASDGNERELFIGSILDDQFGHVISFGIGGISVEVYEDVEFRAVPLEEKDVHNMIENLEGKKILQEFRGKPPVDKKSLVETVIKFSKILEENEKIKEIDVNPLFAGPTGTSAVDALITLSV